MKPKPYSSAKEPLSSSHDGRRAARNSVLNLSGVIIPAILAIAATPIILLNLGPQGFGIFSIQMAVLVLIGVNDFGISRAMTLEAIARGGFSSTSELKRVVWAGIHLITVVAIVVVVFGGMTIAIVMTASSLPLDQLWSWALLIPAAAISLVTLPARAALEVQERFGIANILRVSGSSLLFAGPALATYVDPTLVATSVAMLVSRVVLSIASIAATRRLLSQPDWPEFISEIRNCFRLRPSSLHRNLIRRGGWLGSAGVASMLLSYVDRLALGVVSSAIIISHYVVPAELVTKMWLVTGAFTAAIMPRLAHYWRDKDPSQYKKLFNILLAGQLFISLAAHITFVFFGSYLLRIWLGAQYDQSMAEILSILSVGITINSVSGVNYVVLILHSRERALARVQFVALFLTVFASLIAAYHFSAVGVAWVFSGRLLIDAVVVRILVPTTQGKIKGGVPPTFMVLWVVLIILLYGAAQIEIQ